MSTTERLFFSLKFRDKTLQLLFLAFFTFRFFIGRSNETARITALFYRPVNYPVVLFLFLLNHSERHSVGIFVKITNEDPRDRSSLYIASHKCTEQTFESLVQDLAVHVLLWRNSLPFPSRPSTQKLSDALLHQLLGTKEHQLPFLLRLYQLQRGPEKLGTLKSELATTLFLLTKMHLHVLFPT